jgi:autotransporter-associated beta strand protein
VVNTANRTITNIGTALNLGRLMFTNTNSFTGNLTLNAGELRINGDGRLGNAYNDLNFNGGLLRVQTNFTMPASRVLTMQAGGAVPSTTRPTVDLWSWRPPDSSRAASRPTTSCS